MPKFDVMLIETLSSRIEALPERSTTDREHEVSDAARRETSNMPQPARRRRSRAPSRPRQMKRARPAASSSDDGRVTRQIRAFG